MRIVIFAPSVNGAMGQYLEALVPKISELIEITLVIPETPKLELKNVHLITYNVPLEKNKKLKVYTNLRLAYEIWKEILAVKPNLIHIFNGEGYPWSIVFSRLAQKENIPYVVTVHDPEIHLGASLWERINAILRYYVLRHAQSIHVHSERFVKLVRKFKTDVVVIPHINISERFLKHANCEIPRQKNVALFFGRIEPYKGLDLFVETILRLDGEWKGIIAGPGKINNALKKIIESNPEKFEIYNKFLTEQEIAQLFQRSSVLVLPYKQATQSSLPMIGAAFGLPVVSTPAGAFVEDVPKVGGIVAEGFKPEHLVKAIITANELSHPRVPVEYLPGTIAEKFVKWYHRVIEKYQRG